MKPKLNSDVGHGDRFFKILVGYILFMGSALVMGCILLVGGAPAIPADVVATALIFAAVLVTATTGICLPYFRLEIFGGSDPARERATKSPWEVSHRFGLKATDDAISKLDCPLTDDPRNNGMGCESLLDAAVDRIIQGMDRDWRNP